MFHFHNQSRRNILKPFAEIQCEKLRRKKEKSEIQKKYSSFALIITREYILINVNYTINKRIEYIDYTSALKKCLPEKYFLEEIIRGGRT